MSKYVDVCDKTKLPSSYGLQIGKFPFFINNEEGVQKYSNDYLFDGTYLILNTGGTASIKFYNGKFSAMSDCSILKPKENSTGLYYFLKSIEDKINRVGFQGTGLKHLDLSWLYKLKVILPKVEESKLSSINELINKKIGSISKVLEYLLHIKCYLLSNLFI